MSDIANKIRALLAKAQGTDNPHESSAFYMKAQELMLKYNIEEDKLGTRENLKRGTMTYDEHNHKWLWLLGASAAKLMHVNILVNEQRLAYFAGRPMNVDMAEEMMAHFIGQVEKYYRMAKPANMTKAERGVFRRNFREGAAEIIWERVCMIAAHNCRALVISPQQLAIEFKELTGVDRDAKTKAVVIRHDSVGTNAGRVAGQLIELGKEVKQ